MESSLDKCYDNHSVAKLALLLLAIITLAAGQCVEGEIRLVNSQSQYEGRVEICLGSRWGTVCDDNWKGSNLNAQVTCRQLGYSVEGALTRAANTITLAEAPFGAAGPVLLDDVLCSGDESKLTDCPHITAPNPRMDCTIDEAVGVTCQPPTTTSTSEQTTTAQSTRHSTTHSTDSPSDHVNTVNVGDSNGYNILLNRNTSLTTSHHNNNTADNNTNTSSHVERTPLYKSHQFIVIISTSSVAVVVIALVILSVCVYIKRKKQRDHVDERTCETYENSDAIARMEGQTCPAAPGDGTMMVNDAYEQLKMSIRGVGSDCHLRIESNPSYVTTASLKSTRAIKCPHKSNARQSNNDEEHHYETIPAARKTKN